MKYCCECGKKLKQRPYDGDPPGIRYLGAYHRCCNGVGYWADRKPLYNIKLTHTRGFWLYLNEVRRRRFNTQIVLPKLEE